MKLDSLRSQHLDPGVRPITACFHYWDTLKEEGSDGFELQKFQESAQNVQWNGSLAELGRLGIKYFMNSTDYLISPVTPKDKYSRNYQICTGVCLAGTHRKTKKEMSFMTHHNSSVIIRQNTVSESVFNNDFGETIERFIESTAEGTRDAVIFGGDNSYISVYLDVVKKLNEVLEGYLSFQPVILAGPSIRSEVEAKYTRGIDVYFETQKRILHVLRQDFNASESNLATVYDQQFWINTVNNSLPQARELSPLPPPA